LALCAPSTSPASAQARSRAGRDRVVQAVQADRQVPECYPVIPCAAGDRRASSARGSGAQPACASPATAHADARSSDDMSFDRAAVEICVDINTVRQGARTGGTRPSLSR
jgi:hypothetical protein